MLKKYGQLIGVICLLAFSAWGGHEWSDRDWSQRWAERDASDARASVAVAEQALAKQKNLLQELDNAKKTAKILTDRHNANIAAAADTANRLRSEIARIKAMPAITHASTIAERANAATDRRVLAVMLGESDSRAGKYAEEADRLRIALIACNAEYGTIKHLNNSGGSR